MNSTRKRAALRPRWPRVQVESLETRALLTTTTVTGAVLANFTSAPLPGRVVYADLNNDGRLDTGDPSATTDASGIYTLALTSITAPTTLSLRVQINPGDQRVPAAATVVATPGGSFTAATLRLQATSQLLPLTYSATPYAGATADVATTEVIGLYSSILGRAPDSAGLASNAALLQAGMPLGQLASIFLDSPEYLNRSVTSFYITDLGRTPGQPEVDGWIGAIRAGASLEQVLGGFLASPEFTARYAANAAFVQAVYADVLGRPATAAELGQATAGANTPGARAALVTALLTSPESDARAIQGLYAVFLARAPEGNIVPARTNMLQHGETLAAMAAEVAGSAEAAADAAAAVPPVPPPTFPVTLAIPNRVDYVFGADGILYITDGADVDRYNTKTGATLAPFTVGGQLKGIDLSPDGTTLAVADASRTGIDLISTATGVSTPVDFTPDAYEGGAYDVAWGADGTVLVSTTFKGSGTVPLRSYNPATATTATITTVNQNSVLAPSADRKTIGVAEGNNSGGPVDIYDVAAGKITANTSTQAYIGDIAVSPTGAQIFVPSYEGSSVYAVAGSTLTQQTTVGNYTHKGPMYAVYSPTAPYLFTANYDDDGMPTGIEVYSTTTFAQVATLDATEIPSSGNYPFGVGWLKVSPDGKTLAVSTDGGTKLYDVSAYATA